ncbi:MAG: FAD/NAD(P)-binding protein [Gemmatimonadetes bacterium]|nr:FAD/NAD(P)-binding protein [Gemmatimonadota bacterium]
MTHSNTGIVVIGGGFSGAMVTAHLLRLSDNPALRITLVNKSGPLARGVAYGTRHTDHVLNVPAGRMSAFPDREDHFLRFAQERIPSTTGGSFVPRTIYGDYLASIVEEANQATPGRLEVVADEAHRVAWDATTSRAVVTLASGRRVMADHVVLALGNYSPSDPPLPDRSGLDDPRYIRDPWIPGALAGVGPDEAVLLIGTGLTMLDVAIQLNAVERRAPVLAISRRGLTPLPHRDHGAPPSYGHLPPALVAGEPSAVDYLRAVRRHVRTLAAAGVDWREVVASLRPVTPRLWEALPMRERARFLRHLRPYWDVHRHRVAPELWHRFDALRTSGHLQVQPARLLSLVAQPGGLEATIRPRRAATAERRVFSRVINCTGPEGDVRALRDPLLANLIADGLVRPDALGLGLDVGHDLALIAGDGSTSPFLSLVGPLLKGTWWEATAVPELRGHASRLAARLVT